MRIKPINEKYMTFKGKVKTPCQIMRDIYCQTEDEDIKYKCRVVSRMLKIMASKISEHDLGWERIWSEDSDNNS
jgi:hypothetical protein